MVISVNMKEFLQAVSLIALVILIIQVVVQFRRVKQGGRPAGHWRALSNWFVLAVLVISFGGSFVVGGQTEQTNADYVKQTSSAATQVKRAPLVISFPGQAHLTNGKTQVAFIVPRGAQLHIKLGDQQLASFDNANGKHKMKFSYCFTQAGTYRISGVRGHQRFAKTLKVNDQSATPTAQSTPAADNQAATANAGTANSTVTDQSGATDTADSPGPGYHYEYRTVLVPVYADQQ